MDVRLFRVILPAADMERSIAFYGTLFDQTGEQVSTNRHYFECGGVILAIVDPRGEDSSSEVRPNPDHVYFAVGDLEAMFERAQAAGCSWLEEQIRTRVLRFALELD